MSEEVLQALNSVELHKYNFVKEEEFEIATLNPQTFCIFLSEMCCSKRCLFMHKDC